MGNVWNKCHIDGTITTCDPGQNRCYDHSKTYERSEIYKGMNLCAYEQNLPNVLVKEIGDDYLVLKLGNKTHTLYTGQYASAPRQGLNYAYSDADIYLKE